MDRDEIHRTLAATYEARWREADPWPMDAAEAEYTRRKNARQRELLGDRRYRRALEIGCGNGNLTPALAALSDAVLAVDIAPSAIALARQTCASLGNVEFRQDNAVQLEYPRLGPWDLITLVETVYSLGWLYPLFDVAWMAEQMAASLAPEGRLLLTNTYGAEEDYLLRPYLIDTYRDLFRNVGLRVLREEVLRPTGEEKGLPVLMTIFSS